MQLLHEPELPLREEFFIFGENRFRILVLFDRR
jgi:hypothetical protein